MYEVELKFPLADPAAFVGRLAACGASQGPAVSQADLYFNHPSRDFKETDEAFRIRTVDDRPCVTYKGPVVDSQTKTRREIEVALAGDQAREKFAEILRLLGFRAVREVRKRRQTYFLVWQGREFEIAVDEVQELGVFAEIETLSDEPGRLAAVTAILSLVSQFQLPPPERQSYLSLLLAKG
ncbi:MAG: class IV adenylate cyclase [Deltaproteobacteria bacterium]